MKTLGKFFVVSFLWGFFQWFYTGGDGCGFASFPTLGLKAYENKYVLITIPAAASICLLEMDIVETVN